MKNSPFESPRFAGSKHNLFYEARPIFLILVGLFGLFNHTVATGLPFLSHLSHLCGLILLGVAIKIIHWRKQYRKSWF